MEAVYALFLALNHYWEADKDAIKLQARRSVPWLVLCLVLVGFARQRLAPSN